MRLEAERAVRHGAQVDDAAKLFGQLKTSDGPHEGQVIKFPEGDKRVSASHHYSEEPNYQELMRRTRERNWTDADRKHSAWLGQVAKETLAFAGLTVEKLNRKVEPRTSGTEINSENNRSRAEEKVVFQRHG